MGLEPTTYSLRVTDYQQLTPQYLYYGSSKNCTQNEQETKG